jgi:hypothetical protein
MFVFGLSEPGRGQANPLVTARRKGSSWDQWREVLVDECALGEPRVVHALTLTRRNGPTAGRLDLLHRSPWQQGVFYQEMQGKKVWSSRRRA